MCAECTLAPAHSERARRGLYFLALCWERTLRHQLGLVDRHAHWRRGGPPNLNCRPEFQLTFARLFTHYWSQGCFLQEGQTLAHLSCTATAARGKEDLPARIRHAEVLVVPHYCGGL